MLVFNNPKWPFTTVISAPHVAFSSEKLVQRHVNSFLMGRFLIEEVGLTSKADIPHPIIGINYRFLATRLKQMPT
ncbi:hypothetical protein EAY39_23170 [Vibrio anguillarum]|nr:hypothetical protein [Vibrio anguillarum]